MYEEYGRFCRKERKKFNIGSRIRINFPLRTSVVYAPMTKSLRVSLARIVYKLVYIPKAYSENGSQPRYVRIQHAVPVMRKIG